MVHEASLYRELGDGKVKCRLCAHECTIAPGRRGICQVRENRDGRLYSLVYGRLVAENIDPIEKKPLYHFQPGSLSYSVATAGCNLSCSHCQNYQISMLAPRMDPIPGTEREPEQVVAAAEASRCRSIAYTYTEPTVFMEFAHACGLRAAEHGIANVFVTNGFMSAEAAELTSSFVDAANIDLKGATEEHYRTICGARLEPVLETIRGLHGKGVWIEITTLLIPGLNDDDASLAFMAEFIASLDPLIPWHISRFHPTYRMTDRPPTPMESILRAGKAGRQAGLRYIYPGNIALEEDLTPCHRCGHRLLERSGFAVINRDLDANGCCPSCGEGFHGVP